MSEKMQTTSYRPAEERPTYQTGSTKPPKSHGGVVVFMLSVVIFVCGICTILSLMRVKLPETIYAPEDQSRCRVAFSPPKEESSASLGSSKPGFDGQALPKFWQDYRSLPEGIYITRANKGLGLYPGDILMSVNGEPVSNWDSLVERLEEYDPGEKVKIIVFRDGAEKQLNLVISR